MRGGDRTSYKLRLVLEGAENGGNDAAGTLTNQEDSSKTVHFGMSDTENTQPVHYQRMLSWESANSPKTMYFYISANEWSAAVPGTYSGTVSYNMMWGYASDPIWSDEFDYGSIPITVTIPEPSYPVTVTADPSEGGTAEGAGDYLQGTQVNLTATPSDGWRFKEWQVVSGGVTIENNSFTMPDHAVEVKAVFADPTPRYTYDPDTKELHLTSGDFDNWEIWKNGNVPKDEVLSVTAEEGVRFVGECYGLFSTFIACKSIELSAVDTSLATDMSGLFVNCYSRTSLDLSGWDTGAVTDMSLMFANCQSLTDLDLSSFDTGNVAGMSLMFVCCKSLVSLDLSGFDTAKVENMERMFSECENLVYLALTGFNTSAVTDMSGMFKMCKK